MTIRKSILLSPFFMVPSSTFSSLIWPSTLFFSLSLSIVFCYCLWLQRISMFSIPGWWWCRRNGLVPGYENTIPDFDDGHWLRVYIFNMSTCNGVLSLWDAPRRAFLLLLLARPTARNMAIICCSSSARRNNFAPQRFIMYISVTKIRKTARGREKLSIEGMTWKKEMSFGQKNKQIIGEFVTFFNFSLPRTDS